MTTAEPITRKEWDTRKMAAPPELLALHRAGEAAAEAERAQCDELWSKTAELMAARRAEFETALARLLESEGAGWLSAYRLPDHSFAGPHKLDLTHRGWFAEFDLTPVGFHRIRVELHNDCSRHTWTPARSPWGVMVAQGPRWCSSLSEAVRVAARYESCPF
jgi:hypothetical protein